MFPVESYSRKKKGPGPLTWLIPALVLGIGGGIYYTAPSIYYRFLGNEVHRIKSRADLFEERYAAERHSSRDLYLFLEDSRKIIESLKEDKPSLYLGYYYGALFDFYELLLRVSLDGESLLSLVGRGYLPLDEGVPDTKTGRDIPTLARDMAIQMRRALALKPDMNELPAARLIVAYGDLFYNGRTDPYLFRILGRSDERFYRDFIQPRADWIQIILYTYLGKKELLEALIGQLHEYRENLAIRNASETDEQASSELISQGLSDLESRIRLEIPESELNLIHAFALYYTKDYMRSLRMTRTVKRSPEISDRLKISATRLEGEIFLKQRGPLYAARYFQQALDISEGRDEFILERLQSVKSEAGL